MDIYESGSQLYIPDRFAEGALREKASKFYSFVWPVKSKEEVEQYLKSLKKKYYNANHHCYAWRLGSEGEMSYANDAGEPAYTAGMPILSAIRSAKLTQTLVVVVRYFGGTKLGKRGLINAYRESATIALNQINRIPVIPNVKFKIHYSYDQTAEVQRILHQFDLELVDASYTDTCMQEFLIKKSEFVQLQKLFSRINISVSSD